MRIESPYLICKTDRSAVSKIYYFDSGNENLLGYVGKKNMGLKKIKFWDGGAKIISNFMEYFHSRAHYLLYYHLYF